MPSLSYIKLWEPTQIGITETEIYECDPVSTSGTTMNVIACITNTTSAGITVEVWVVPSGGSSGDSNKFINSEIVPANDRMYFTSSQMKDGDKITAKASATGLTIHPISGIPVN